jgi:flagellar hook-basal body complex protein FliE
VDIIGAEPVSQLKQLQQLAASQSSKASGASGKQPQAAKAKAKTLAASTPGSLSDPSIPYSKFKAVLNHLIREIFNKSHKSAAKKAAKAVAGQEEEDVFADFHCNVFKSLRGHLQEISREFAHKHKINYEMMYVEAKVRFEHKFTCFSRLKFCVSELACRFVIPD